MISKKILFYGRIVVLALLACGLSAGCNRDDGQEAPRSLQFVLLSGHNQAGAAGTYLPNPVVVRLQDESQNPLAGERVYFRIVSGGGATDRGDARTDNAGEVSVHWQIGTGPEQILKASLNNDDSAVNAVYIYANSQLSSAISWTQGINFYAYGRRYPHDNRILESSHFLVFSDGSSDDAKVIFAKMAEESLAEMFQLFAVESSDVLSLDFADSDSKIKIFSIKDANYDTVAFRFGFILFGPDSNNYLHGGIDDFWLRREVKHETMHVVQWLFGLDPLGRVAEPWPEVWFTEGIAEYISGGVFAPISNLEQWESWLSLSGHTNPVAIHQWADFTIPYGRTGEYYPAFSLAVRYLLDSRGVGRTTLDVKAMVADMVSSGNFAEPFARTFGMTVEEYEDQFPELIADYLQRTGTAAPLRTRGSVSPFTWSDQPRKFAE
jgi:hypothetical protein